MLLWRGKGVGWDVGLGMAGLRITTLSFHHVTFLTFQFQAQRSKLSLLITSRMSSC